MPAARESGGRPAPSGRISPIGIAQPPVEIPAEIWEAFDGAADRILDVWTRAVRTRARADKLRLTLDTLTKVVRSVAGGAPLPANPLGEAQGITQLPLTRVIGLLRYHFLARVRALPDGTSAHAVIQLLTALEQLERRVRPAVPDDVTDQLVRYGGAGLAVQVAHDMRSPLTSILFLVEALRSGQSGPVTPLQERQLGLVYSAAFGLSAMASDLVELARGADRLIEAEPISFSVLELLHGVRDIVQPIAEEKGLEIRLVPPLADARRGYPLALHRVLLNLVTNALKFTDTGWVAVEARELSPTRIEFAVSDTGEGITEEVRSAILEVGTDRGTLPDPESFSSTGLGLTICRRLVEDMGGALGWEGAEGGGSCFRFALELPYAAQL